MSDTSPKNQDASLPDALSSGRNIAPHEGLISIGRSEDGTYVIAGGYDEIFSGATGDSHASDGNWSADEKRELAEFMIGLWTDFKNSIVV